MKRWQQRNKLSKGLEGINEGDSFVPLVEAFGDKEFNGMLASEVCSLEIVDSSRGKNGSPMRK